MFQALQARKYLSELFNTDVVTLKQPRQYVLKKV